MLIEVLISMRDFLPDFFLISAGVYEISLVSDPSMAVIDRERSTIWLISG